MSKYNKNIWTLITRVLSGEATTVEESKFRIWLNEDPKHKVFFKNIKASWTHQPEQPYNKFFFDYESGLGRLRNKLDHQKPVQQSKVNLLREKKPAKKRRKLEQFSWAMAAVILLAVSVSVFSIMYIWGQPDDMETYATSSMEQRIITLLDGSVVRLNQDSKIDVRVGKSGAVREVYLRGEAFFDVFRDPERPFVIHTDEAVIEVLGTSFNVKEADDIQVAVKEGMVSLRNRAHEEKSAATLVAGQLGILSGNRQDVKVETENANIENYMNWMNGYLRFDSMPFHQVVRQLERIYESEHLLDDPDIGSIQLTVYTEQMDQEELLNTIALALDLKYVEQEGVIHWRRDG
ncbi:MAG: FecR domain-containing protein [Bacteroidales bacterium]